MLSLRFALSTAVAGITAVAPSIASAESHDRRDDHDMVALQRPAIGLSRLRGGVRVFLNGGGGTIRAGSEDAMNRRSAVLYGRGIGQVAVPAYSRESGRWASLVSCVRDQFRGFDVEITDRRPASGTYTMVAVGGHPSMLRLGRTVGGIAPYNGDVIDGAIAFVFEQAIDYDRDVCESTAHEIGHTLGLDHSTLCSDTMSYGTCGLKAFRDQAAHCGEYGARMCGSGSTSQNSRSMLANAVGFGSPASPTPSRRKPAPSPPSRPPGGEPVPSTTGPRIQVTRAPASAVGNSVYTVQVRARDDDGIARVELLWTNGDWAVSLRCGDRNARLPVRCTRRGDEYTFALRVGHGTRAFAVRVTDGTGNQSITHPRVARFVRGARAVETAIEVAPAYR